MGVVGGDLLIAREQVFEDITQRRAFRVAPDVGGQQHGAAIFGFSVVVATVVLPQHGSPRQTDGDPRTSSRSVVPRRS